MGATWLHPGIKNAHNTTANTKRNCLHEFILSLQAFQVAFLTGRSECVFALTLVVLIPQPG